MKTLASFLAGKKTYLVAAMTVVTALLGFWGGMFTASQATDLLVMAGGLVGIGAKLQRHHDEMVAALTSIQAKRPAVVNVTAGATAEDVKSAIELGLRASGAAR